MSRHRDIRSSSTDSRDTSSLGFGLPVVESTSGRAVICTTKSAVLVLPTSPTREVLLEEALDALTSAATEALPAAILSLRQLPRRR